MCDVRGDMRACKRICHVHLACGLKVCMCVRSLDLAMPQSITAANEEYRMGIRTRLDPEPFMLQGKYR